MSARDHLLRSYRHGCIPSFYRLLPPQSQGQDPPYPTQHFPPLQGHPGVVEGLVAPSGLAPAPEPPQWLGLRGEGKPMFLSMASSSTSSLSWVRSHDIVLPW